MKNIALVTTIIIITLTGCIMSSDDISIKSPDKNIDVEFFTDESGTPYYYINYKGRLIIEPSSMGFEFLNQPQLNGGLEIVKTATSTFNETWEMPWGEQRYVLNHYNEVVINLKETESPFRQIDVIFRVFNDGVGFRYSFPEQEGVDSVFITEENTEFNLMEDPVCWWIPGDWDIYEHLYNTTRLSEIDALSKRNHPDLAQTYIPNNAVNTPVTMKTDDNIYLSFHEANLTDYSGMTLGVDTAKLNMKSILVGTDRHPYKVAKALPFKTPWRTILITDNAPDLIASKLILNLNEPNKLGDVDYFTPMKYVGIWWEMHIDKSSWDMASGKHGATTENAKKYIDFASGNNIQGLLVEGWNTGWEHWIGFDDREGVFDFVTPYPDYDLDEVARYAKEKGVEIIMHHETSGAPRTYEQQLDTAQALMNKYGINSVKTGYVGTIIPKGEYHHGQWMVNHYRKVIEKAAENNIAVNAHEPIKATGIRRTYPNVIAREGLRGQEYNAWASDGGNPPEHLPVVAFTRMLAGPIDFTPGVFDIKLKTKPNNQINTTLAHQLALYVVIYSPIQMACDIPENYNGNPAFEFIREVGVDWEKTVVLDGEVGDFVVIAREERDSNNWFVGAITDENARDITIDFSFLEKGKTYRATIYRDGDDASWDKNPQNCVINDMVFTSKSVIDFELAPGGGLAVSLIEEE